MYVGNEGGGGLCTTGYASLSNAYTSCVAYVDWTWALGGHSGSAGRTTTTHWVPIYYPSGNWNNYYLVVYAKVTLVNGTVCKLSKSLLLNCGTGPNPLRQAEPDQSSMYPNPIKVHGTLNLNDVDDVTNQLEIFDMNGDSKGTYDIIDKSIDIGNLEPGHYFILYMNQKGIHRKHFIVE
ncbi:T9SS type A sorting domain-containing protein [Fulvivirga sp. 29W222]|uniref:T9SS type A sorting domain-containing protein n=1 Tax=Fulvivirga marina TaxID=2494733 RepID=A0A937KFZ1_9BACT|nr:T9SS type A sorting domain-containing protein [Fulvivirga marina]MBL6448820.1 T9SS type A sorting domain-containing protein [Fulvivirga marina]